MELAKIRSLSDDELLHQEKTTSEQLFRLRFQVSLGQNDGVKKIRELSWASAEQRRTLRLKPSQSRPRRRREPDR